MKRRIDMEKNFLSNFLKESMQILLNYTIKLMSKRTSYYRKDI